MDYTELVNQAKEAATSAAAHAQAAQEALSNARSISLTINTDEVAKINACKEAIRQAIETKGQPCPKTTAFNKYAGKILSIVTGTGSNSSTISSSNGYEPGFDSNDGYSFIRRNIVTTSSYPSNNYLIDVYDGRETGLISVSNKYKFKSLAAGSICSVAIGTDGNLYTWGNANYGFPSKKGNIAFSPMLVDGSGNWKQAWENHDNFFILNNDGELFSFGYNDRGQIGEEGYYYRGLFKIDNIDGCRWKKAATNQYASYFLTEDGRLFSCGANDYGLRGIGDRSHGRTELTEIYNIGGTTWSDITANYGNAYALTSTGEIYGWGRNGDYQLGYMNGNTESFSLPNKLSSSRVFKKISAGENFMAAIDVDGLLWSIGSGSYGRNGFYETVDTLTRVGDKDNWEDLACFQYTTQAVDSDGKIYRCGAWVFQFGMGQTYQGSQSCMTYIGIKSEDCFLGDENYLLVKNFEIETQLQAYFHDRLYILTVPDNVTKITSDFIYSKVNESYFSRIYIPNTVEEIDSDAFECIYADEGPVLFFQASKEEVESMDGYPWGLDYNYEEDFESRICFNCEFEHDEKMSDLVYFIENNFPDDYTLTVPASAVEDFNMARLYIENAVLEGDFEPYYTMFYEMPKLKNITVNRSTPCDYYIEGRLFYDCPSKITVTCNWAEGDYPMIEETILYDLKDGDEVKYTAYYEYGNYFLSQTKTVEGNMTRRIMVYKEDDDSKPTNLENILSLDSTGTNGSFVVDLLDSDKKIISNGTILKKGIYYISIKNTSSNIGYCRFNNIDDEFNKCYALVRDSIEDGEIPDGITLEASHNEESVWCMFNAYEKYAEDGGWYSEDIGVSEDNPTWFSVTSSDSFIPVCVYIKNEIETPENFRNAKIQGKDADGEWVDLYEISDSPDTRGLEQYIMLDNDTEYYGIRMYFTEAYNSGVSIQSFNVYSKYKNLEGEGSSS